MQDWSLNVIHYPVSARTEFFTYSKVFFQTRHLRSIYCFILYYNRKEALFEEPLEKVWEKGGSGLVFYTDAAHWARREVGGGEWDVGEGIGMGNSGDLDELHADDWDVDTRAYYERSGPTHTPSPHSTAGGAGSSAPALFGRAPGHCAPGERDLGDLLEMRASDRLETLGGDDTTSSAFSHDLHSANAKPADDLEQRDSDEQQTLTATRKQYPQRQRERLNRKRVHSTQFGEFERHTRVHLQTFTHSFFRALRFHSYR